MPKRKAARHDATSDEEDGLGKREAELKRREEEIGAREGTLKQREEEIGAREATLKQREEELQKAEEEFSEEAAKAYGATKPDDIITLDVGGTQLRVLRSTLCYVEGSMLASMFSGRWDDNMVKDGEGAFFIDQPYEHFKALLDFFRSCKSAAVNGPRPSIEAVAGEIASNPSFMRMVDYYNCTLDVYPFEITRFQTGRPKNEPMIRQYPNMSIEYDLHPEDGDDNFFIYRFSSIGHSRLVTRVSFRLDEHERLAFCLRASNGEVLMTIDLTRTVSDNILCVPNRQGGSHVINLVEMNERCKRPMQTWEGTKSSDTVQCEFDTNSSGVRFKSVKINDQLIFSCADMPEDVCGDNDDSLHEILLEYGIFLFSVEGKVCITDLVLA